MAQKIWASPNTIIGLVIGLAGVPFGADIGFGNGAIQFTNYPWFGKLAHGFTLGHVQIYPQGNDPLLDTIRRSPWVTVNLGLHEQGHTAQYEILGPAFLPLYFLFGGPDPNSPFEVAADAYALGGSPWPW